MERKQISKHVLYRALNIKRSMRDEKARSCKKSCTIINIVENYILSSFKKIQKLKTGENDPDVTQGFLLILVDKIIVQIQKIRCNMICFML